MARKATSNTAQETVEAPEQQDQITLVGRLVADPELRFTNATGKPVSNIRIAVNDGDVATFHSIVVWGRQAEVVCQFLKKGRAVEVTGRTQQREYKPEDGEARQITEIVARSVEFLPRVPKAETQEREVA